LPDKYRAVILLCEMEGKTRKEAARQLRVPEGSVAGWLVRGRALLAKRLTRRGVVLSGGSLAATLVQYAASANAPAAVVTSTIQAAPEFAAGPGAAGAIPPQVVTLTEGVLKSMLLTKLKFALAVVLAAGILGIGVSGVAFQATAGPEPKEKAIPTPPNRIVNDFTGADTDLKQLKAEVDRLRAEVEALKKLLRPGDKTATPAEDKGKLIVRVYAAKDLIAVAPEEELPPAVIRIITGVLEPMSWANAGGTGSIEYFPAGGSLVVNQTPEIHERFNPANFVSEWRTPMLVTHDELDLRVPYSQGLATFTALQRRGIESRFVVFPDENHWVLKPANSIFWYTTVLDWMDAHTRQ